MLVIALADLGHRKAAGGTQQQLGPQPFFQQRHAAAEFGFGQAQRPARGRKAAVFYHLGKVVQLVEVG